MRVVCIIPARLKSTRLPRKPLIDICGKTMIERTYRRALEVFDHKDVFIATEADQIYQKAKSFGANVLLTSDSCMTGTDRVAEAAEQVNADYYVNLQGDEPIMPIQNIDKIHNAAIDSGGQILNGYAGIQNQEDYYSNMIPKVVINEKEKLLYMSRAPIPGNKEGEFISALKQICLYSFTREQLQFCRASPKKSQNEEIEDIEILRYLDAGFEISMVSMSTNTVAVDTIYDHSRVELIIKSQGENLAEYDVG